MVELSRWGPIESQDAAVQPIISGLTQELNALATGYPKVAAMKTRPFSTHQFAASSRGSENVTETGCKPIATPNPMGKKMSTTQQIWGVFHPESRSDGMEFTHQDRCHLFSWHFYRVFPRGKVWFPLEFVTKTEVRHCSGTSVPPAPKGPSTSRPVAKAVGEVMASKWEKPWILQMGLDT